LSAITVRSIFLARDVEFLLGRTRPCKGAIQGPACGNNHCCPDSNAASRARGCVASRRRQSWPEWNLGRSGGRWRDRGRGVSGRRCQAHFQWPWRWRWWRRGRSSRRDRDQDFLLAGRAFDLHAGPLRVARDMLRANRAGEFNFAHKLWLVHKDRNLTI